VIVAAPSRPLRRSVPWLKVLAGIGIAFYLFVGAEVTAHVQDPFEGLHVLVPITIALFPICTFLTFRYPVIFPFGLYVLITPIDALLAVSGVASIVKLIGMLAAGALVLRMLLIRRAVLPHKSWYFWAAFVVYASLSISWTPDFDAASTMLTAIILLFVMMTILAIYPAKPLEFKFMLASVVVSGVAASIYSLAQYHAAPALSSNVSAASGALSRSSLDSNRLLLHGLSGSNVQDPNYLGGSFLLAIALALAAVFYGRNIALRLASAATVPPMIAAILATGSRSAFLAAVAIFGYFIVRSKYRVQALLATLSCLGLVAFFPTVLARLISYDFGTADGRTDIWRTGMHSFGDHWLFGAGIGSYGWSYDHNVLAVFQETFAGWDRPGHSVIFVALNDYGIIGFSFVMLAWYFGFRQLKVIPKTHWMYGPRIGLEAGMLGLFIHMLLLDPFFVKYVWLAQSLPLVALNMYAPRAIRVGLRMPGPRRRLRTMQSARGT
jgi:hypothetical protein